MVIAHSRRGQSGRPQDTRWRDSLRGTNFHRFVRNA